MDKAATIEYPIHELLKYRWSTRAFSEKPVEEKKILSLLEAARWAPSCFNEQPWYFIVGTKEEPKEHEKLLQCLMDANQTWAKQAPVLMLTVAQQNFSRNNKPNRHAWHDVGLATENLVIEAMAQELLVHQMAGFAMDKAVESFAIPDGFEPVTMLALGYLGDPLTLPESLQEKESAPRKRKPLKEFVFGGKWGSASSLIT